MPSRRFAFAITLAVLIGSRSAAALGPAGSEIDTSDDTIDLHQGPITGSSRVIGMAGSRSLGNLPRPDPVRHQLTTTARNRRLRRPLPVALNVFGLFDDDTTFRVGGALDSAERYFAWTASLGIWR